METQTQTQELEEFLRSWRLAPTPQPGFGSIPFTPAALPNSGFVWSDPVQSPPEPAPEPKPPARPAVRPFFPAGTPGTAVPGLIPHTNYLVNYGQQADLDPSSLEIVETCERVYLCRFVQVYRPDPVLPIVGLHWPRSDKMERLDKEMWDRLRTAYSNLSLLLATRHDATWLRGDMARSVNNLLDVCTRVPASHFSAAEYEFTAHHLTQAMLHPDRYT